MNRMTNRCKNITLPQTSFAGGKNSSNKVDLIYSLSFSKTFANRLCQLNITPRTTGSGSLAFTRITSSLALSACTGFDHNDCFFQAGLVPWRPMNHSLSHLLFPTAASACLHTPVEYLILPIKHRPIPNASS